MATSKTDRVDATNAAVRARLGPLGAFHHFARRCSEILGSPRAFVAALVVVTLWGLSGPLFHFSDLWQLIINTSTSIGTFLMLFVLQHSQNYDTAALHLKLDEIIRSIDQADDRVAGIEQDED